MQTAGHINEIEHQQHYLNELPTEFTYPLFNARRALESQRRSGYRNTAAAREIVDNAFDAFASQVHITFETAATKKVVRSVAFTDVERLGGRGVGVHSLRKTTITNALNNGAPVHQVQELAGHADIRTTQGYYMRKDSDAAAAARHIQIRYLRISVVTPGQQRQLDDAGIGGGQGYVATPSWRRAERTFSRTAAS